MNRTGDAVVVAAAAPVDETTAPRAPKGFLDRVGTPWVAQSIGRSPRWWGLAAASGASLAWLAFTHPGGITEGSPAGVLTRLAWVVLMAAMPLLAIVDARSQIIPNRVLYPTAAVIVALLAADFAFGSMSSTTAWHAATSGLVCFAYAFTLWYIRPDGFGWGDVKLTGVVGLVLGTQSIWTALCATVIISPLTALAPGFILSALDRSGESRFAFGPYIVIGAVVSAFIGQPFGTPF